MFETIFIASTETQRFAYISVVFVSVAFKLMARVNLDVLQPASHSSLQEFGPIRPDRSGVAGPSLYAAWFPTSLSSSAHWTEISFL